MDRRVMGVETEYGIHYSFPSSRPLAPDEVARYMFRPVMAWGESSNVFIHNGSRLYLDVGSHPEFATAECSTAEELIALDKAGDHIMNRLVTQAQQVMSEDGFSGTIFLYRNNADSRGNSYGSHENYMITRNTQFRRLADALIPFLVTRQLVTGAGVVITDPQALPLIEDFPVNKQPHFAFSQRADYVQDGISSSSTRARPIINTRDEPHADSSRFRRLHVIVADSNMSETTMLVRFGITDLLLRMIESGVPLPEFELSHPVRAIRQVSHDLTGTQLVELRNGNQMSALELQFEFLGMAQEFLKEHGTEFHYLDYAMDLWQRGLEAVQSQDYSAIDTEIDWAIKHKFLRSYATKNHLDYSSARLKQLDMSYHDIDPNRGLYNLLQPRGMARKYLADADIQRAVEHAPTTTRAVLREKFIRAARQYNAEYTVDWTQMKLNDRPMHTIYLKDPLQTESAELEQLIAQLKQ